MEKREARNGISNVPSNYCYCLFQASLSMRRNSQNRMNDFEFHLRATCQLIWDFAPAAPNLPRIVLVLPLRLATRYNRRDVVALSCTFSFIICYLVCSSSLQYTNPPTHTWPAPSIFVERMVVVLAASRAHENGEHIFHIACRSIPKFLWCAKGTRHVADAHDCCLNVSTKQTNKQKGLDTATTCRQQK